MVKRLIGNRQPLLSGLSVDGLDGQEATSQLRLAQESDECECQCESIDLACHLVPIPVHDPTENGGMPAKGYCC